MTKIAPKTVEVKLTRMHGGKPWMTSFDNPLRAGGGARDRKGLRRTPVFNREGGSIPVVSTFQEVLGLPDGAVRRRPARRERARAEREAGPRRTSTTASSRPLSCTRRSPGKSGTGSLPGSGEAPVPVLDFGVQTPGGGWLGAGRRERHRLRHDRDAGREHERILRAARKAQFDQAAPSTPLPASPARLRRRPGEVASIGVD